MTMMDGSQFEDLSSQHTHTPTHTHSHNRFLSLLPLAALPVSCLQQMGVLISAVRASSEKRKNKFLCVTSAEIKTWEINSFH